MIPVIQSVGSRPQETYISVTPALSSTYLDASCLMCSLMTPQQSCLGAVTDDIDITKSFVCTAVFQTLSGTHTLPSFRKQSVSTGLRMGSVVH